MENLLEVIRRLATGVQAPEVVRLLRCDLPERLSGLDSD